MEGTTMTKQEAPRADEAYLDPDHPSKPSSPIELTRRTWAGVAKRSLTCFHADNCTDWAAALTYYGVLALFPSVIVLVALAGVISDGQRTVDTLLGILRDIGAGGAVEALEKPISDVVSQRSAAGAALWFGLLGALWSASGYIGAFTRASNAIYGVQEGRKIWKLKPIQIAMTLVALVLVTLVALGLVVSGPVTEAIGNALGLGDSLVTAWEYGKWPVLLAITSLLVSLLYWFAPNVQQPKFRWFTVGGTVALLLLIAASVAFGFYIANFASYNKTYGSLGAVVIFLVWLYIANLAILLGAEINVELERGRELQAGMPAEEEIQLPPREPADETPREPADEKATT
jgi:membrane protein